MATLYITRQFDRIDRICHAHYGTANGGIVEFVLKTNPGLEDYGILLPPGIKIRLEDRPKAPNAVPVIDQIHLW